ncbi:MAG: hypothetical protein IKE22_07060 [Atopobiaceae bacterium]|nr:hypothetical protein [Atopobiaceae bacterium]
MSDLLATCDWEDSTLVLVLPNDPERIMVELFDSKYAPRRTYVPWRKRLTTHAIIVSDESTDCATGHCECELCGEPIDPWDKYCRHCGAEVEQ